MRQMESLEANVPPALRALVAKWSALVADMAGRHAKSRALIMTEAQIGLLAEAVMAAISAGIYCGLAKHEELLEDPEVRKWLEKGPGA